MIRFPLFGTALLALQKFHLHHRPKYPAPVHIPYTSPAILSAQLRKQAHVRHIAARLKEGTLLIGDLVIPIPSPSSMSNQQLAPQLYALPQQLA